MDPSKVIRNGHSPAANGHDSASNGHGSASNGHGNGVGTKQSYDLKNGHTHGNGHQKNNDVPQNGEQRLASKDQHDWRQRNLEADEFLKTALPALLNKVFESYKDKDSKVVEFLQPEELRKRMDLKLYDEPTSNDELEAAMEDTIRYSVKTGHPYFFNQLFGGVDPLALSGAIINETLNSSCYTYEVAPVGTLMELEIIKKIVKDYIGFPQGDGTFCPGGSAANMYGLSLARFRSYPESKTKGMQCLPSVHIYTSNLSHYSLKKAAFFLGFGLDSIIEVATDSAGRMVTEKLDEAIQASKAQGFTPLMVNATAGTTVMGAFDDINGISEICKKHSGSTDSSKIWLHVDGAWGGSVLLSPKLKYKMKGIEKVDSLTWDPHKMTGAILQCAVFVTRHGIDPYTAPKEIASGVFLLLLWRGYGSVGMGKRVEACFEAALYLRERLLKTPGFRLLIKDPECTNLCFWYIPESLRGQEENKEWWQRVSKVAPAIKARMQMTGSMLIGYQPQGDYVNFFRMVVAGSRATTEEMDHVIHIISSYGEEVSI